ncbi:MAG: IPT/TIG domain-containing protein, partial [Patescibacteria group bacterium]
MRRPLLTLTFLAILLLGIGSAASVVQAQEIQSGLAAVGETVKLSSADPRVIAANIINVALGLLGIIFLGLMVYAGFLYMTSGGEAEKTDKAKKMITSAIIGLILVLSSWAIAKFVIDRLIAATGGGGGTTTSQGGTGGGGLGGSGVSNVFQVKSITPQGDVPIRNVQVKILFSRPVDETSASVIAVTRDGGGGVAGTIMVNGSVVTFTPASPCPAPNADLLCFDADAPFTVTVGGSLRSTTGQTVVCGGFAPSCTATFRTGNLIDTQPPTVSMVEPLDGQGVPADSLVTVRAHATDESGVAYVDVFDEGALIDSAGPDAVTVVTSFDADVVWDTAGIPLQATRELRATAYDIDTHSTQSSAVRVVVRPPGCFNGVQDGDESGVDCGGSPNTPGFCGACSGGSCTENSQCASGVCSGGTCVEQPTITEVRPTEGKPGTFVTIKGVNLGSSGTVTFLGGAGDADDVVAQAPQACAAAGLDTWSSTQVIVAVPEGASIGPLTITNGQSNLSDTTNNSRGPGIPDFVVNDASYPGLCGLDPKIGYVGDQFRAVGQGFGSAPSRMTFGGSVLTSFAAWTDGSITANVPVSGVGSQTITVTADGKVSNPANFQVQNKSTAGPPVIGTIDPSQGPISEYITLTGTNFGYSVGTVRFKNVASGVEAMGDTSFPEACSAGFWRETNVVVKVPSKFLNETGIVPGDYQVTLVRSDNVVSNQVAFVVNTETPRPGICSIIPTVGPVGTDVTISGERFGTVADTLTFSRDVAALASSWASTALKAAVPTGAVTGPVSLAVQGVRSNGVNYQVRNCNEQADVCSQSEQCCPNGTCIPGTQMCGAVAQSAMFAWRSSTGLIPVSPRVVEECAPDQTPAPIPSPSPWDKRAGGTNACVTASVAARFTTHLEPSTVTKTTFRIRKCTSASNEPCTTTEDLALAPGFPLLQPASIDQDLVMLQADAAFDPSTTYLVEILTGVKGAGATGAFMDESTSCGPGIAYCFRFKTRASTDACKVGAVSVSPHPYTLNDTGLPVPYLASPLSSDDKCVVLRCDGYGWQWQHGDDDSDGRAMYQTPLIEDPKTNGPGCRQIGYGVLETGNVPVNMNATVLPDGIKGTGHLFVKFVPPKVQDYAPKCQTACINARIWARFNVAIDPESVAGNVVVRPCANENCVLSELGAPLPIPSNAISVTIAPKTTDLQERFLRINPITALNDLLLVPGKYYRVLLKGGTDTGIRGLNGVPMTGLNDPDGFAWTFRTKLGTDAYCAADTVDVAPLEKIETVVGSRQMFVASAFSAPDDCSAIGQMLLQTTSVSWQTSDASIADYMLGGIIDTGGDLPPRCSAMCLSIGSQAEFGKVAVCGNGIIETTDSAYCSGGTTSQGDACTVLPTGARAGEQCDPGVPADVGLCDASSCLWKPIGQIPQGTCGNGAVDKGEACDFGRFCLGASPTSTTPDMTPCVLEGDKAVCESNGGTCAPVQTRGCSTFCRHTGAKSGDSTCGNGDVADGEDCDDGNLTNGDGCSTQCLHEGSSPTIASVCGNAIPEPGESCEKHLATDPTFPLGCLPKTCLHTGTGLCDNDTSTPDLGCCGNGNRDLGEDCDDGNKASGDGCGVTCLLEGSSPAYRVPSFCGDGGPLGTGEQCESTENGDGRVDAAQLATIVGDADPDENGLMTAKLSATLESKTGDATYGLQCGFDAEASCPAGYGLTTQGCCNVRPQLDTSYPSGSGVCRNVEIRATFNVPMDRASILTNVQIAKQADATCPNGTTQVTDDFRPVTPGFRGWVERLWVRLIAWLKGDPAIAAVWCTGSVTGRWMPRTATGTQDLMFRLDTALEPQTDYRVKFFGDPDLGDNAAVAKRAGIRSSRGVVAEYDTSAASGPLTFSFRTGDQLCALNTVQVTDTNEEHPLLFVKEGEKHPFTATAASIQNGVAVPIVPVTEYSWAWSPWTTSDGTVVEVMDPPLLENQAAIIQAKNKN